jgi:hypothetical protein
MFLLYRYASILSRMGFLDRISPVALGKRGRTWNVSCGTRELGYSPLS